jgi:glyoxylase-like metal-dependent hydrolase (beta-lactamase superfamily II)
MVEVTSFTTAAGRCIYSFPITAFPGLEANIYLIDDGNELMLVDCGSGLEESNRGLVEGLAALSQRFSVRASLATVSRILITHAHMDHFGGLPFVRQHTNAPIGVSILDRRVLTHYEERVLVASKRLNAFLTEAGVAAEQRATLMTMYLFAKDVYRSTPIQFLLAEGESVLPGITVHEAPGHCPGQVCLQVDDVLLTADHVLARTTPHQAPERITHNTGLGHYLASLTKIGALQGVRLALGGHEEPMDDLVGRIEAIRHSHEERLGKILDICHQPRPIADISRELFGPVRSYHVLLALEEAGAHVEYLYQRGELSAANLDEIEASRDPVVLYRRV